MSSFLKSTASPPVYLDTAPTLRKKQPQHQDFQEHYQYQHYHLLQQQYGRRSTLLKPFKRNPSTRNNYSQHSIPLSTLRPRHHYTYSLLVICTIILISIIYYINPSTSNLSTFFQSNTDENNIFVSLVSKRVATKWRGYLSQRFFDSSAPFPKLYFPRHCPSSSTTTVLVCAKPVPSFIFAGSEMSGSKYVFEQLRQHPQVAWTMDTSKTSTFSSTRKNSAPTPPAMYYSLDDDDDRLDKKGSSAAFETYLSQFPFLTEHELNNIEKQQVVVGEHAPHYLYKSYSTARRIRETLPHVKLVFILRDPIDRAYTQFLHEKSLARRQHQNNNTTSTLSFDALVDLELSILHRCGHTSIQTGWEGFVRCHEGSEIRATWNITSNNDNRFDALKVYDSLAKGMYYNALLPFLQEFPASQVYVTRTEDFVNNPSSSFQKLAKFLGIQEQFFSERNFYGRMANQQDDGYDDLSAMILQQHRPPATPARSSHHHQRIQQQRVPALGMEEEVASRSTHDLSDDHPVLDLSIRYRLEKLFKPLNQRLMELFENQLDFGGWDYDVDRG
ncbi:P-loop containing nucleoside triphosphate hydrolase protein [Chlamydoabsidia padenii]|nr:P-loop containing nucleoside triphosphate hydrolase protein [Chlamydoabsidia padenii]